MAQQAPLSFKQWILVTAPIIVLVGAVFAYRASSGGAHGEDCTQDMCAPGHSCIERPNGSGRVCAATCESDADCDGTSCLPLVVVHGITGSRDTPIGDTKVCVPR